MGGSAIGCDVNWIIHKDGEGFLAKNTIFSILLRRPLMKRVVQLSMIKQQAYEYAKRRTLVGD